jgi:hypothetical protein
LLRPTASRSLALLAAFALASACATSAPPSEALVLAPIPEAERAMQTRVFATDDEAAVLDACIAVLQRHGFGAEDQDAALGVIVAYKDAESAGHRTRLRASLATLPAGEFGLETQLRITFQRLAWNARGRETLRAAVREPGEYAGFFREVAGELALPTESLE